MSHLGVWLTGNCIKASVLVAGAIDMISEEAAAEDRRITGLTDEGLNCGTESDKRLRDHEKDIWSCQYHFPMLYRMSWIMSHKYLITLSSTFTKQAPATITKYTLGFITDQGQLCKSKLFPLCDFEENNMFVMPHPFLSYMYSSYLHKLWLLIGFYLLLSRRDRFCSCSKHWRNHWTGTSSSR